MTMKNFLISLAILLTGAAAVSASTVKLAEAGAVVPYGKSQTFTFKAPAQFNSARLHLKIRMDSPDYAGSTYVLHLTLNGQVVGAAIDRTHYRLVNKPLTAKMVSGLEIPWFNGSDWRVVYAPQFGPETPGKVGQAQILNVSPYVFVFDISNLVKPGQENHLTLANKAETMNLRHYFPGTNPSLDFYLGDLTVDFSNQPPVGGVSPVAEKFSPDRLMVQPPATMPVAKIINILPGGGLKINLPDLPLTLQSSFSYQGGGFNTLGQHPTGEADWQVTVQGSGDERLITGTARQYRLERQVHFAGDHLEIADRLTNLTGEAIGLAFNNHLTGDLSHVTTAWLGGNPNPAVDKVQRLENSTAFLAARQSGCGLLAIDDVYRLQEIIYYQNGVGIRSDTFALAPHASYTLRWNLYPVGRADYYDFINLARRDLGVNFTVPGGFQFGLGSKYDDAQLKHFIAQRGVQFMSSGVWMNPGGKVPCYHGAYMLQATGLRKKLAAACAQLRRVAPQVKSLVYMHAFINTDPQGPKLFPDARVIGENGQQYENKSYTASCGIPFLYYYPTLTNSYFPALKKVVDMILDRDKIGADGVYWDELDLTSPHYTYNQWDDHTAILDSQHRIVRKVGNIHLLSLKAKVALINYIHQKGGFLIANSAPTTETLTELHFPRFVETAQEWYPARAHLYTPISLGDHLTVKTFPELLNDIRTKLMWGSLYYYYAAPKQPYPTITQHMFPFTPVELHHGWLLGKERLITAVPGTFTLGDTSPVKVYWYDAAGKLTDKHGEQRVEGGRRLVRLALGDKEMAVIERQ